MAEPSRVRELHLEGPLDLRGTLGPLVAGARDPTMRLGRLGFVRATHTPEGPATVRVELVGEGRIRAEAWGAGANWILEHTPDLLGVGDPGAEFPSAPRALREIAHRARGVRLPRTHRIVEMLTLIVLQQLVSGQEASRAFANLVRAFSEPAPGSVEGLMLPLGPRRLRGLPEWSFAPLGIPVRQGRVLGRLGWHARRIEEADGMAAQEAARRLMAIDGIGPWSAASAMLRGMGHPDAVPLGDYNLPRLVAFNLAGEEQADDARMLCLLEPYRGQRGRIVRWLLAAGRTPPRRGPRHPLRPLPGGGAARVRALRR